MNRGGKKEESTVSFSQVREVCLLQRYALSRVLASLHARRSLKETLQRMNKADMGTNDNACSDDDVASSFNLIAQLFLCTTISAMRISVSLT